MEKPKFEKSAEEAVEEFVRKTRSELPGQKEKPADPFEAIAEEQKEKAAEEQAEKEVMGRREEELKRLRAELRKPQKHKEFEPEKATKEQEEALKPVEKKYKKAA